MDNNRNFIIAIALSLSVLLGWQFLYMKPASDKARQQAIEAQQQTAGEQGTDPTVGGAAIPPRASSVIPVPTTPKFASREAALAATQRIAFDTSSLTGSINLKGGSVDDVTLKEYRQTVDPNSPPVTLLSPAGSPEPYYAYTGWYSDQADISVPGPDTVWKQQGTGALAPGKPVTLTWDNGKGLVFKRAITLDEHYMFTITDTVENKTGKPVTLRPRAEVARLYEPTNLFGYSVLHEGLIGLFKDAGLKELTYSSAIKNFDPAADNGKGVSKEIISDKGGWLGFTDQYWAAVLVPDQSKPLTARLFGTPQKDFFVEFSENPVTVATGASETFTNKLFAGAKKVVLIEQYMADDKIDRFDKLVDWGWFPFLTQPLYFLLNWLYLHVGNFGIAILLTTVLVKVLFFPLANKSYSAMNKLKMLQPEMKKIQERFKDDKQRQQHAMMTLYKKEKVNPAAGCLPILVQIPVFFALYKVLLVSIEMRHAPFYGWIHDLSAPDPTNIFTLFGLIPWTPPHFMMLGALPLIMGCSMWLQMRLNPTPPDPIQQKIFAWMPVLFTFMLAPFQAGLILYWTWNNILTFAQQALIMKRQDKNMNLLEQIGLKKSNGAAKHRSHAHDVAHKPTAEPVRPGKAADVKTASVPATADSAAPVANAGEANEAVSTAEGAQAVIDKPQPTEPTTARPVAPVAAAPRGNLASKKSVKQRGKSGRNRRPGR
ncbi:membrane protein insertase, YidC/Oxa1 family [Rhodomicrobium vannielii ATCC 17100]|uniref:Membrane protein insertase YidC n=1 Tax=Rhodomicrobium vannielii (strain ATCC 17100 / DSM 162 / LMG 4299 / NCIMB 10020 / ATH 3.1.1) TaxID=648757 RepID=E3I8D6_RHOVT|nr:membrane protein insertase YidC [Rhodomicrobium vannielii]ADP69761.1 membrane protein insertase, YidC/Oxa1 family [Rhodomicrobium vannielii ATCC 17100]